MLARIVKILGLLVLLGLVVVIAYTKIYTGTTPQIANQIQETIQTIQPDPFEDLTIPYLRNREYNSNLAELIKNSENSAYTSYLTSYDSDGFKVNAQFTQPKGEIPQGGFPAIIFIHGYIPPSEYQTLVNYASYVDYLARNGFVVFKIDLRGHGNSEGEPGGGYYSSDYIVDALNAYSALQNSPVVNKDKIGFWGHSMAGNVIMRAVATKQTIPAVVIWAGAVYTYEDMAAYGIDDNSYRPPSQTSPSRIRRNQLMEAHGPFDPNDSFWKKVPATNYLDGVTTAIQINHAVNDNVVSIEYSRNLMRILDSTPITHELKEYSSGGHNISGSAYNQAMRNTVEFFSAELQ